MAIDIETNFFWYIHHLPISHHSINWCTETLRTWIKNWKHLDNWVFPHLSLRNWCIETYVAKLIHLNHVFWFILPTMQHWNAWAAVIWMICPITHVFWSKIRNSKLSCPVVLTWAWETRISAWRPLWSSKSNLNLVMWYIYNATLRCLRSSDLDHMVQFTHKFGLKIVNTKSRVSPHMRLNNLWMETLVIKKIQSQYNTDHEISQMF